MTVFTLLSPQKSSQNIKKKKRRNPPTSVVPATQRRKAEGRAASDREEETRQTQGCADAEDKGQGGSRQTAGSGSLHTLGNARQKGIYRAAGTCWKLNLASHKSEQIYN